MEDALGTGMGLLVGILVLAAFGAIAGWLAGVIVKGSGFGLVGDIVIGIFGAWIAGFLFNLSNLLGISIGGGVIGAIVSAVIGAVILLLGIKLVQRA